MLFRSVRKLVQSSDGVEAVSDAETIGGRYAIVSVPPVLAGRIEYEPAVSVGRDQVTQRFAMGAAVKVLLTYERAFWRDAGLRFVHFHPWNPGVPACAVRLPPVHPAHRIWRRRNPAVL